MPKSGFNYLPPAGVEPGSREYFTEYSRQRNVYFRGQLEEGVEEEAEPIESVVVLEQAHLIPAEELGQSPKLAYRTAQMLDWQVQASRSLAIVAPVLYVSGSAEGAKEQYAAGDVRFEGYFARHYWVEARSSQMRLGFRAHWMGRGSDKTTASFDNAFIFDPVGIPRENYVDYTKDKNEAKLLSWSEHRRVAEGIELNSRINDGSSRLEHDWVLMTTGGEFTQWLDDWLDLAGVEKVSKKKAPTKAEKAAAKDLAILDGEDWQA